MDEWLTTVREALENSDSNGLEAMDQFKLDLYEDEVFVFTPKGDLFKYLTRQWVMQVLNTCMRFLLLRSIIIICRRLSISLRVYILRCHLH